MAVIHTQDQRVGTSRTGDDREERADSGVRPARSGRPFGFVDAIPFMVLVLAPAPLLYVHFQQLWSRPHYQFFPMVLVAFAYFALARWPSRNPPSRPLLQFSHVLIAVSVAVLGYAFVRLSPLAGCVSMILSVGALLVRAGIPALGPWLLLWLLIRIPYGQDVALIQWMQRVTTGLSSTALETIAVEHIAQGNILSFPERELFVEEACSGVVSLLAIVACSAILAVWWRRSLLHSLLLVITGLFWAGAMNVVRVVSIAVALDRYGVDLTEGWRHEALGLVVFAVSLLALFSTDRLLLYFLASIQMNPLASYWSYAEHNLLVRLWNTVAVADRITDAFDDAEADVLSSSRSADTPPRRAPVAAGLDRVWERLVAGGAAALLGLQIYTGIGPFSVDPSIRPAALGLSAEELPEQWGAWTRRGFRVEERDSSSAFGEHSRIWTFEQQGMAVVLSADFVFPEYHELTACYAGVGWKLVSRRVEQPEEARRPFVEATFTKPGGEHAYLLFDVFDAQGDPYEPPSGGLLHPQLRRVLSGAATRWTLPSYYQVQLLVGYTGDDLDAGQRRLLAELFEEFRHRMIDTITASPALTSARE
jgi:exosortase